MFTTHLVWGAGLGRKSLTIGDFISKTVGAIFDLMLTCYFKLNLDSYSYRWVEQK